MDWPGPVLWTRLARLFGVVGTCADGKKIRIFMLLVISVLLYGFEILTLNTDLKRQIDALVIDAFAELLSIAGMISCQISDCSVRLN